MSSNASIDYLKMFAKLFLVSICFIIIPLSFIIGIVGVNTTAILHSTIPRPERSAYLILTEATSALTIVISTYWVICLHIPTVDKYHKYHLYSAGDHCMCTGHHRIVYKTIRWGRNGIE